jgi:hypothetical protein
MTVERADLPGSLSLEQTAPVSAVPGVQGQASPGGGEGKPPRRPPPEETSAVPSEEERDQPPHRIDSLA